MYVCICHYDLINIIIFVVVETKGRSLEEMDEIFGGQSAIHDAQIMNEVQNRINQNPVAVATNGDKTETSNVA